MGRQVKADQRERSQRATAEVRGLEAQVAELQRKLDEKAREMIDVQAQRSSEERRREEAEATLAAGIPPCLCGRRASIDKLTAQSDAFYGHVDFHYDCFRRYDEADVPALMACTLSKLKRKSESDFNFAEKLLEQHALRPAVGVLLHEHEKKCAAHLQENVYTEDHFSLMRLVGGISKRVCGLIEQSIKWIHKSDGTKQRQTMCEGSTVAAPTLFSLKGINASEARAEKESGLILKEHPDRKGADISGQKYALDRAILDSVSNSSRAGGMATKGDSPETAHLICVTGDGAGLTDAQTGVRVGHFPGSTELLNQSSADCVDWIFYKENSKAEDYTTLSARLVNVLPDMRRLYRNGELMTDDGVGTGIFIKFVLTADKPFIRHCCGMLSHNANAFGAPLCMCCDETEEDGAEHPASTMYDLKSQKSPRSLGSLMRTSSIVTRSVAPPRPKTDWRSSSKRSWTRLR